VCGLSHSADNGYLNTFRSIRTILLKGDRKIKAILQELNAHVFDVENSDRILEFLAEDETIGD
jgi:hypothetical protein